MPIGFSESSLFLSLVVSGLGAVLFLYGRKQQRPPQLVAGLLLSVYPYFVPSAGMMLVIAIVIVAGMWLAVRQGW